MGWINKDARMPINTVVAVGIVGLGPMGRATAHYLVKHTDHVVNGYDNSEEAINGARRIGVNGAVKADATKYEDLRRIAGENDVIISAVPQSIADQVVLKTHELGKPVIDLIFMWSYNEELAHKLNNGPIIIPACGWAPGLTNLLAMAAASELEAVEEVGIHVGGNPVNPRPPLYYELLFSLGSTADEYVRPATIIRDGKVVSVEPLAEIFDFRTWLVDGDFAEFYTDGLSTLLVSLPKYFRTLRSVYERTIRWRRHLEVMRVLKDLGLLSDVETAKYVLSKSLRFGVNDFSITVVEAVGEAGGDRAIVRFEGIDHAKGDFTSMARLTGFTAAIIADLVAKDKIKGEGLTPIEEAYISNRNLLNEVINGLSREGIKFWRSVTSIVK
ncbi:saccharopine dehydrogenase C-terminal domain-containing protein [Vulcanisaeta souniana]|uniref:Saccharopine reductase n=1 Tax=Vulcanisaeta souniana JCM 11219 TaxID=1293586 RepID=A0A830EB88_9CREN|nr:saccharopine dehydrogenase C-terminal domain-containing protein [Vulcanisaeta souniana]BDR92165.1 saccharopine reductase [Vulcanisaeta souniana JCM 11219]GGI67453.1 saccharopine reductase [Vulcanisaeta souniana JCM 11219]